MNKMTTKTTECVAAIVHLHVCSTKLASTTALTSQSLTECSLSWIGHWRKSAAGCPKTGSKFWYLCRLTESKSESLS